MLSHTRQWRHPCLNKAVRPVDVSQKGKVILLMVSARGWRYTGS